MIAKRVVTGTGRLPPYLKALESEAIFILREGFAQAGHPVLLFSGGKDSTVLAHLATRAFYPAPPPMPLLHIDSTWEFDETIRFRDELARELQFQLIVERNDEGFAQGISPFVHGSSRYTELMRTQPLRHALDRRGFDVIFGGARRDEEKTRAKERIFSMRGPNHTWDPRMQRGEFWSLFNAHHQPGQSVRVFPLSNWTEADVLAYAHARGIALAPLYFAEERPVVERDGTLLVVNDARFPFRPGEKPQSRRVRFRTVGCWPVTGESEANTLDKVLAETLCSAHSERQGRLIDADDGGSLEQKKREGYF